MVLSYSACRCLHRTAPSMAAGLPRSICPQRKRATKKDAPWLSLLRRVLGALSPCKKSCYPKATRLVGALGKVTLTQRKMAREAPAVAALGPGSRHHHPATEAL